MIAKEVEIEVNPMRVHTPQEIYDLMTKKSQPKMARDYYHRGRLAAKLTLWDQAEQNYKNMIGGEYEQY